MEHVGCRTENSQCSASLHWTDITSFTGLFWANTHRISSAGRWPSGGHRTSLRNKCITEWLMVRWELCVIRGQAWLGLVQCAWRSGPLTAPQQPRSQVDKSAQMVCKWRGAMTGHKRTEGQRVAESLGRSEKSHSSGHHNPGYNLNLLATDHQQSAPSPLRFDGQQFPTPPF